MTFGLGQKESFRKPGPEMLPPPAPRRLLLSACNLSARLLLVCYDLHTCHIRSGVSVSSDSNSNKDNGKYNNIDSIDCLCFVRLSVYMAAALLALFPLSLTAIPVMQMRKPSLIKIK